MSELMPLQAETLHAVEGGRVGAAINLALARLVTDCRDRPGDDRARTVTIEIRCKPVADTIDRELVCDGVQTIVIVKTKAPAQERGGVKMIRIHLGPGGGTVLDLRRAPLFLRVVVAPDGTVDALDQLDDTPEPDERVVVYVRHGSVGKAFYCTRGKGCRVELDADYIWQPELVQPGDEVLRDNEAWRAWVEAQVEETEEQDAYSSGGESA